jgi:hypothetical protein
MASFRKCPVTSLPLTSGRGKKILRLRRAGPFTAPSRSPYFLAAGPPLSHRRIAIDLLFIYKVSNYFVLGAAAIVRRFHHLFFTAHLVKQAAINLSRFWAFRNKGNSKTRYFFSKKSIWAHHKKYSPPPSVFFSFFVSFGCFARFF